MNSKKDNSIDVEIEEVFSKKNITEIKKPLATVHIALSSANQKPEFDNTPMSWKLDLSNSRATGSVSTMAPLSNLYRMKIAEFMMFWTGEPVTPLFYDTRNMHLLIEEFASQAFLGPPNFHFSGVFRKAGKGSDSIQKVEFYDYNRGNFYFTRVIEVVDSFTIRLYDPFEEIVIPRQLRYAYVANNSSPIRIQFTSQHYLLSQQIEITEFNSDDTTLNAAINGNTFDITIISSTEIAINYSPANPYNITTPIVTNIRSFSLNITLQLDYFYE